MADSISLDLDALAPKAVVVKFQEKEISVKPLSVELFAEFAQLSNTMQNIESGDDPAAITPVYQAMVAFIGKAIPELENAELNLTQVLSVFELLTQISAPQDTVIAELEKRGVTITQDTGGPKEVSTV